MYIDDENSMINSIRRNSVYFYFYKGLYMKKLRNLMSFFFVGLSAVNTVYADAELQAALQRAQVQFNECMTARGRNKRGECVKEYNSLVACMHKEADDRRYYNSERNDSQTENLKTEYDNTTRRIEAQFRECMRARGMNKLHECRSERAGLLDNAFFEYKDSVDRYNQERANRERQIREEQNRVEEARRQQDLFELEKQQREYRKYEEAARLKRSWMRYENVVPAAATAAVAAAAWWFYPKN